MTPLQQIDAYLKGELSSIKMKDCLADLHYAMITKAVSDNKGSSMKAARALGMKRTALLYHIKDVSKPETTNENEGKC